jgi:hypothetical protein
MSVGGVFQLITNQGIQDKIIMDTENLRERIKTISMDRLTALRGKFKDKSDAELLGMDRAWAPRLAAIEKTHILFVNSTYKPFVAMSHEYSKTPTRQGRAALGQSFSFTMPIIGDFVNDCVMYVKLTGFAASDATDKVKYVELLGHRLMKNVKFKISNHVLDEYTSDDMNVHYQFKVPLNKETGYLRNVGQETARDGFVTADPTTDEVRKYVKYGDGAQTFKRTQADIEMWIPILFWFRDIQTSLPNFLLPMGQTDIEIEFESEANLIAYADYGGGGAYTVPSVSKCFLYLNHIFLQPDVQKLFLARFGFQLIRVHQRHTQTLQQSEGKVLLHGIKWPVESLYISFRPQANLTNSQKWHRGTSITDTDVKEAVVTGIATIQVNTATYFSEAHVIASMELRAHDTVIYPKLEPEFYNQYIPYRYGEHIKTPRDLGWYMMNFNVNPGEYQPSGHLNVSKSRELYLHYTAATNSSGTSLITSAAPADLIVVADCINFLLTQDGTATLRFST